MSTEKKPLTITDRVLILEYNEETTDRHLKEVREIGNKTYNDVSDIKNAIIGSSMNGDYGLIHSVKDIRKKQDEQEEVLINHRLYFKQMGVVITAVMAIIVGLIIRISSKL
jgi:hypothetical protein